MDSEQIINQEASNFVALIKELKIFDSSSTSDGKFEGKFVKIDGKLKIDLTRLDYLALGQDKEIKQIMIKNIEGCDLSCPASQMVMKSSETVRLENSLADLHGMSDTVLFTSGYAANDNIIQALGLRLNTHYIKHYMSQYGITNGEGSIPTIFFVDGESHYSLVHGAKIAQYFSKGINEVRKFKSADYDDLTKKIEESKEKFGDNAVRVIVTDALSSISGRIFDINSLYKIANKYGCLMYVDEAHSCGCIGSHGRGVAANTEEFEANKDRTIIMGTLTKAFSQLGGYVVMPNKELSDYLKMCSPQYIFSAPIPPWMAETLIQTVDLITGKWGDRRRELLYNSSKYLRDELVKNGFDIMGSNSQIIPVSIKDDKIANKVYNYIRENGFISSLFRYPAIPKGSAMLRFSICADITKEEIDDLVKYLKLAREKYKF